MFLFNISFSGDGTIDIIDALDNSSGIVWDGGGAKGALVPYMVITRRACIPCCFDIVLDSPAGSGGGSVP